MVLFWWGCVGDCEATIPALDMTVSGGVACFVVACGLVLRMVHVLLCYSDENQNPEMFVVETSLVFAMLVMDSGRRRNEILEDCAVFVEQVGFAENEAEIKVILGVDPRFREDDSLDRAVNGC
ncbi:MAG TPA: hypothetical protein VLL52_14645 [Anaerolineae bacterium]|nr:hypothetical protein [Anaerolineae bacterium]